MLITVTEDHIKKGIPCDSEGCPIVLAIEEATGKLATAAYFQLTVGGVGHKLPAGYRAFLTMFDSGGEAKPFSFELEAL